MHRLNNALIEQAMAELAARDTDLAHLCDILKPPRIQRRGAGFEGLVNIIVSQQVSVAAASSIKNKLKAGIVPFTVERWLDFSPEQLREFGLSRQKAGYCLNIATAIATGELNLRSLTRRGPEAAVATLCAIKGLGRWSADIYLLFHLHRSDAFPAGDLGLQAAAAKLKRLKARPTERELIALAEPWRPWRGVAARLLWGYLHHLRED